MSLVIAIFKPRSFAPLSGTKRLLCSYYNHVMRAFASYLALASSRYCDLKRCSLQARAEEAMRYRELLAKTQRV